MFKEEQIIKICKQNKWRLTEPRLEVLRIISLSKNPIKAYDILKKLANKIKNPKPPTAYRAIQFWQKHKFIHRIESRSEEHTSELQSPMYPRMPSSA